MKRIIEVILVTVMMTSLFGCANKKDDVVEPEETEIVVAPRGESVEYEKVVYEDYPVIEAGIVADEKSVYIDKNNDQVIIPKQFKVSEKESEQTINTGVVVIGPDGSEFVWVPTNVTPLMQRDFGVYMYGADFSSYEDESNLPEYQEMVASVEKYNGFYMGRFEASQNGNVPASKRINEDNSGKIWVHFSPQDATVACQDLYKDNDTVQGFFPWGCNFDTTLQWLVDSGCKSQDDIDYDSTSWGNYSDDTFSNRATGKYTGMWEETNANNIYDLAGNNWEWTQERYYGNYVMRSGGYNLMGGSCSGSQYPAAIRDPLPGNNHHPNVCFRVALYLK